jgi:hypothetical protein
VAYVSIYLSPAILVLIICWAIWFEDRRKAISSDFRENAFDWSLRFATVCLLLELLFLSHGYEGHGSHSFVGPPRAIWLAMSWCALILWIFSAGTGIMGKGKLRILVFKWWAVMPFCAYAFFRVAYD